MCDEERGWCVLCVDRGGGVGVVLSGKRGGRLGRGGETEGRGGGGGWAVKEAGGGGVCTALNGRAELGCFGG